MFKVDNIGTEGIQVHTIPLAEENLTLELRYLQTTSVWTMSVAYKGKNYKGAKLTCGVLHMRSGNFPFDFIVEDTSGADLDPYAINDFSEGRCILYRLEESEMESIRQQKV